MPSWIVVLALVLTPSMQPQKPGSTPSNTVKRSGPFEVRTIDLPKGKKRKYALYIPPQYDKHVDHKWPVILFLHGSGERGSDGVAQTKVGLPRYIAANRENFPFITILPQADNRRRFAGEEALMVWAILEEVIKSHRADPDRIIITGLSMGGFGTWDFAMNRPDMFAAAVPVCGVGDPKYAENMKDLPVWAFHGALDNRVPVSGSREPIEALRKAGGSPKYTEYPRLKHNSWDKAYSNKELYRWMLKQRRQPPPSVIDHKFGALGCQVWWLGAVGQKDRKKPAHIRAEVTEDKKLVVTSEGVTAFAIQSDQPPLVPGDEITVIWNGKSIGTGKFEGSLSVMPREKKGQ